MNRAAGGGLDAVVINQRAGTVLGSTGFRRVLVAALAARGAPPEVFWLPPERIAGRLRALVDAGATRVAVGGGDGTLHVAANVLAEGPCALGILPLGTFNHLAQDLGIPPGLEEAVAVAADGEVHRVDLGQVNGHWFANNLSVGIYPYAVRRRNIHQDQLGLPKAAAMAYACLGALWRLPRVRIAIHADGLGRPVRAPFVLVGNNRYRIEPVARIRRGSLTDGTLCVFYTRRFGRLLLLKMLGQTLLGRLSAVPELQTLDATGLTIASRRRRLKVAMDGEVVPMETPLEIAVRPRALALVCGRGAGDGPRSNGSID